MSAVIVIVISAVLSALRVLIEQRPQMVNQRVCYRDKELDTVYGKNNTAVKVTDGRTILALCGNRYIAAAHSGDGSSVFNPHVIINAYSRAELTVDNAESSVAMKQRCRNWWSAFTLRIRMHHGNEERMRI